MSGIACPVCGQPLAFSLATSKKAATKRVFIMLRCPRDGRHFRGFISHRPYVEQVVNGKAAMEVNSEIRG